MLRSDRSAARVALLGALFLDGCASGGKFDSESHFLCSSDADCRHFGAASVCVDHRCAQPGTASAEGPDGSSSTVRPLVDRGSGGAAGGGSGAGADGSATPGHGGASGAPDAGHPEASG